MNQQKPPYIYEGYAPPTGEYATTTRDTIVSVFNSVVNAVRRNRAPGKPLHTISNVVREAPLGAVCVAFILGVAFAVKRVNR